MEHSAALRGAVRPPTDRVLLGLTAIIASQPMRELMDLVERVARSGATVLVTGESGVGKEMVARALHYYSNRSARPWVDLSCAALPEHLLESELFGHEKGAFSGADSAKPGLFELAHQGSIFLDEIGDLDPRMQVKLLRVLDGVPYYRLGGVRKIGVDVRVVAATNRDLERAVADGQFRGDLYHRLSQVMIEVPPLRRRVGDIVPLARHFLALQDNAMTLTPRAEDALCNHSWPGNIRELRNTMIQASIRAEGSQIDAEDLHFRMVGQPGSNGVAALAAAVHNATGASWMAGPGHNSSALNTPGHDPAHNGRAHNTAAHNASAHNLDDMERRMIEEALAATGGHQQKAAARLGISRRTLSRKLKRYQDQEQPARAGAAT